MPLIGHALAGWATALEARPRPPGGAGALFVPAVIVAAYLPDAVAQVGLIAGWSDAPQAGHSLLFAVAAVPLLAALLARVGGVSYRRGLAVSGVSVLLHDLLDVLQSSDRQPWWPFSSRPVVLERALIPESPAGEAVVFGVLFALYLLALRWRRRGRDGPTPGPGALAWAGRAFTMGLVVLAVATHGLRERRERQLQMARERIEGRDYRGGLDVLEAASRWPSTAKPGRVDYLKGEAYAGLGDRGAAERHYLRSHRADPGYFWAVADLAVFYAGGPEPADERRRRVEPWLARLREEHPRHEALARVSRRVERALGGPVSDLDKGGGPGS